MLKKVTLIISSVRFWILTFGWLAAYLASVQTNGFSYAGLFDGIAFWLGSVAVVGSADSVAEKIGKK
jgi:hypothetical protein